MFKDGYEMNQFFSFESIGYANNELFLTNNYVIL